MLGQAQSIYIIKKPFNYSNQIEFDITLRNTSLFPIYTTVQSFNTNNVKTIKNYKITVGTLVNATTGAKEIFARLKINGIIFGTDPLLLQSIGSFSYQENSFTWNGTELPANSLIELECAYSKKVVQLQTTSINIDYFD